MAFKCSVLTPEAQLLDQIVMQAIIPAHDGLMGVLTGRAPFIAKLGIGPMRIDTAEGKKLYYFVDGGVAQMKGETLTILTSAATPATEIDHQAAVEEYSAAMTRKAVAQTEIEERDKAVQRARVKRALTEHP